jgi:hypothetical protein
MTPREIRWHWQYVSLIPASTFAGSMRSLPYRRPSLMMPGAGAARRAPQKLRTRSASILGACPQPAR